MAVPEFQCVQITYTRCHTPTTQFKPGSCMLAEVKNHELVLTWKPSVSATLKSQNTTKLPVPTCNNKKGPQPVSKPTTALNPPAQRACVTSQYACCCIIRCCAPEILPKQPIPTVPLRIRNSNAKSMRITLPSQPLSLRQNQGYTRTPQLSSTERASCWRRSLCRVASRGPHAAPRMKRREGRRKQSGGVFVSKKG
ncbi:hypothetical protein VTJ04DRAFT_402 [Mycothermus thermophilus]|uniref:uncharacterized protein n=1 Tax=Humicola insolens TaxID=85995 RepID=UPI003742C912